MATITLIAPDISCDKCKQNIEGDLLGLEGVQTVVVTVATKAVRFDYDESVVDIDRLHAALVAAGYPPYRSKS